MLNSKANIPSKIPTSMAEIDKFIYFGSHNTNYMNQLSSGGI